MAGIRFPRWTFRDPTRYVLRGMAATAVAFLLRWSLEPGHHRSTTRPSTFFITFIVATTLVAWYSGFVPSLLTFILGFLLADFVFLEPKYSLALSPDAYLNTMIPPILVAMTIILFGRSMHIARERADEHLCEALTNQEKLQEEIADRKRAEAEVRRLNAELEKRVEKSAPRNWSRATMELSHSLTRYRTICARRCGMCGRLRADPGGRVRPADDARGAKVRA